MRYNQLKEGHDYAITAGYNFPGEVLRAKFIRRDAFKSTLHFEVDVNQNFRPFDPEVGENVREVTVESKNIVRTWEPTAPDLMAALEETQQRIEILYLRKERNEFLERLKLDVNRVLLGAEADAGKEEGGLVWDVSITFDTHDTDYSFEQRRRGNRGYGYRMGLVGDDETEHAFLTRMKKANWLPLVNQIEVEKVISGKQAIKFLETLV